MELREKTPDGSGERFFAVTTTADIDHESKKLGFFRSFRRRIRIRVQKVRAQ
jgi:hypothetical protein